MEANVNSATNQKASDNQWLENFAQETVISLLSQMRMGVLKLVLPDGSIKIIGTETAESRQLFGTRELVLTVKDRRFFTACLFFADLGLAESYMDQHCEISSIRDLISWFLLNAEGSPVLNESENSSPLLNLMGMANRLAHVLRKNSVSKSKVNIREHYDLGNEFFKQILDPSMTYSSALFDGTNLKDLNAAQMAKLKRIAEKLHLKPGMKMLEVGCGWGAFSLMAAREYGVHVTAITISQEQFDYVSKLIAAEKMETMIDLQLIDYRLVKGKFDRIVSIEMIEAVGDEFMDTFIAKLDSLLAPAGLLLMQMITCPDSKYDTLKKNVDFIQKHIFPGSLLPSLRRVSEAMEKCGSLFPIDLFDMTDSYVITLGLWQTNFNKNWSQIKELGFDTHFYRKWNYYFEYCQAAFHMRNISVVQATYSRPNNFKLSKTENGS